MLCYTSENMWNDGSKESRKTTEYNNARSLMLYDIENLQVGNGATRKSLTHKDISHAL